MDKFVTIKQIKAAQEIFECLDDWNQARESLDFFFKKYPINTDPKVVIMKVCLVDSLYGTNTKGVIGVAKHIADPKLNIDQHLQSADTNAVMRIANWKRGGKAINILSFASKYCHFHNKNKFPIYDKYASATLQAVLGENHWSKGCRDYIKYQGQIKRISNGCPMEDIDTFMWLYGIKLALDKGRRDVNKEVMDLFEKESGLFKALEKKVK